jgi:hypothetical protein
MARPKQVLKPATFFDLQSIIGRVMLEKLLRVGSSNKNRLRTVISDRSKILGKI